MDPVYVLLFIALVVGGIGGGAIGINRKELRKLEGAASGATHATQIRRGTLRLTVGDTGERDGFQPTRSGYASQAISIS